MAPRPKLRYSALPTALRAYRGDITRLRYYLDRTADMIIDKKVRVGFTTAVNQTLREYITQLGLSVTTALQAIVANAATVSVKNSTGTVVDAAAQAVVSGSALQSVNLASTVAAIANGNTVPIGDATAVVNGQDNGTAAVATGVVNRVTLPGTDKIVKSTVKYTCPAATGTYINGYTFTIVNGAITAIVAS